MAHNSDAFVHEAQPRVDAAARRTGKHPRDIITIITIAEGGFQPGLVLGAVDDVQDLLRLAGSAHTQDRDVLGNIARDALVDLYGQLTRLHADFGEATALALKMIMVFKYYSQSLLIISTMPPLSRQPIIALNYYPVNTKHIF
jgi:hypothetical protein